MSEADVAVWLLDDGIAGHWAQTAALAHYLGSPTERIAVRLRQPWRSLAPWLLRGDLHAVGLDSAMGRRPWPRLAIGCGRTAAVALDALKRASGGRTRVVQILAPRAPLSRYDLVIAPAHDRLGAPNVLSTLGALHRIDAECLRQAHGDFAALATYPRPRVGLLIGGPARGVRIDRAYLARVLDLIPPVGSLLVSTSRRTPPALIDALTSALRQRTALLWRGPEDGPNPYLGILAHAERIVVSADSVNMLSEACATHAPVATLWPARRMEGKRARFLRALMDSGRLDDLAEPRGLRPIVPLRETASVAAEVRRRLG